MFLEVDHDHIGEQAAAQPGGAMGLLNPVAAAMLLLSALVAVRIPTADAWALLPSTILIQGRNLISSLILVWMHHRMLVG